MADPKSKPPEQPEKDPESPQSLGIGILIFVFVAVALVFWYASKMAHPPVVTTGPDTEVPTDQTESLPGNQLTPETPVPVTMSQQSSPEEPATTVGTPQPPVSAIAALPLYHASPMSDEAARLLVYFPFDSDLLNAGQVPMPSRTINGEVTLTRGLVGGAARFDGSGAAVEVRGIGRAPLTDGLTLEFWVRPDDWKNPYKGSAHLESIVSHSTVFTVGIDFDTYAVRATVSTDTPADGVRLRGGHVPPGHWHHVALAYDSTAGIVVLYLNGEVVDAKQAGGALQLNDKVPLVIGTWYQRNQAFSGAVDEVRLWDRALSANLMRERAGAFSTQ